MHRRQPSDEVGAFPGVRHPSWNGLAGPQGLDYTYRHSCGDLEEACCNRRRSHSHDVPEPPRRKLVAAVVLCGLGLIGAATVQRGRRRPAPTVRRRLLTDDDGDTVSQILEPTSAPESGRYAALLSSDFGPDAQNATSRKRSKAQRVRDEKKEQAAEKRRLLELSEEFEERRQQRLAKRDALKKDKAERRDALAAFSGGRARR